MPRLMMQEHFYGLLSQQELQFMAEAVADGMCVLGEEVTPEEEESCLEENLEDVAGDFLHGWEKALPNWEDHSLLYFAQLCELVKPLAKKRWDRYKRSFQ